MDLDATPFRAFLQVAKSQSFTRAAEELHVSQPALSATIRELERRLGFSLFDRTSRQVQLTWEGRAFLVNARRVVMEHDWTAQRAKEILSNDLRLAVQAYSVLISDRTLLTDNYAAANPDVDVQIVQYGSERIYDVVRDHDADVAIVIEPSERLELSPLNRALGSELETLTLASRQVGLYVPTGHPLSEAPSISSADLKGMRIARIGRVHGGAIASAIGRYLEEIDAEPVRIPEGDAFSVIRYAERHAIAAIDLGWFDPHVSMPNVRMLRKSIDGARLETELVVIRQRREQRPAAERFWRFAMQGAWRGDAAQPGQAA
ncbi:DNA-binding transcriptional LysR family regulator [Bradyrhizobium sp. CIR48]|uniref:LysR family transcriptional regulator n=1 Tax=Bradyrhizobium sp. CIR48 TaxID=2663840 RepID=UPI001606EA3C|nr:LysR family transcriptional regulator [Bradyrhizobium sp. CIR48]MBB4425433.1 DNA-binding transcriptional LysR family regulator [Bradyrhizobium sp. CIR48]